MQDLPDYIVQALLAAQTEEEIDTAIMDWLHRDNQQYRQPQSIRQIAVNYKATLDGYAANERAQAKQQGKSYVQSRFYQRWLNVSARIKIALDERTWA